MRKEILINDGWIFRYHDGTETAVNIPHTWNAIDGQDGGNDYFRGTCVYEKSFSAPAVESDKRVYLEFNGVNASAEVELNGKAVMTHHGGYSTFRADVT
ncbi:MAG: glycoside hydrolase family 2 protein, partial [Clostridia bacterium]|nr:glycoside hydrolase family 2 protein [Clostridia bacterium]